MSDNKKQPVEGQAPDGKFQRGNSCGKRFAKGNQVRRQHVARTTAAGRRRASLARALNRALPPAQLEALLRSLYAQALAGDAASARLLIERVYGKAPAPVPMHVVGPLADISKPDGHVEALRAIAQQAANGAIDPEHATAVAGLVDRTAEAAMLGEILRRLEDLEKARR